MLRDAWAATTRTVAAFVAPFPQPRTASTSPSTFGVVQQDTSATEFDGGRPAEFEGAETTLRLRLIHAVSGEPVNEPELEVLTSMTVREVALRVAAGDASNVPPSRLKLLLGGGVLDSSTRLADLSSGDPVLELQVLRMTKPRVELAPDDADCDDIAKLILVGDAAVGKTSLWLRSLRRDFQPGPYAESVGLNCGTKVFQIDSHLYLKVQMWDVSGRFLTEEGCGLTSIYCRGARAVLIVFDVTNRASFEHVQTWLDNVRAWLRASPVYQEEKIVFALAGNKVDRREADRVVSTVEARTWACSAGLLYFESSAMEECPAVVDDLILEVCDRHELL